MLFLGIQADWRGDASAFNGGTSAERIERACRAAAAGKLAVRDIGAWLRGDEISEPEFRLLWLLSRHRRAEGREPLDQAEMAERLVVSPAQVSGAVERLRNAGWLERVAAKGDRRRQLWQVTPSGEQLLGRIVDRIASHDAQRGAAA